MTLKQTDTEIYNLIQEEKLRQFTTLELIASENLTSNSVMECLGSVLTNKYSEGQPGRRYYGGNSVIDKIENLCKNRALQCFNLNSNEWSVNVQPYSGSGANFAVYTALLQPGDCIVGLDLPSGGHLSHGFQTDKKKISASSIYFESHSYKVNSDGFLDYDHISDVMNEHHPKILICGGSAYPRDIDYEKLRYLCNLYNCYLMADISHINGLVATGLMNNPFDHCDIVTMTTHKTLRGPRSAMIFSNIGKHPKINQLIDEAVFPGLQGGPHNHQIAAVATQLNEVMSPEFKEYMVNVKNNTQLLGEYLSDKGFQLMTGGSDCHLLLINLKNFGITGSKMEKVCDLINISLNKNSIIGDKSPLSPNGIRIGLNTLTSRKINNEQLKQVAKILYDCVIYCQNRQDVYGKKMINFCKDIENDSELLKLKEKVIELASSLYFMDYNQV